VTEPASRLATAEAIISVRGVTVINHRGAGQSTFSRPGRDLDALSQAPPPRFQLWDQSFRKRADSVERGFEESLIRSRWLFGGSCALLRLPSSFQMC
jgi:hypothetical protein